jgi:ribonuclease HII
MPRNKDVLIAGVDEAGCAPLAGPVVAAAVILDPNKPIAGLADSKQLSAKNRERLNDIIRRDALAFAIGIASEKEIDEINILQASLLAMQRAVAALAIQPHFAQVDGRNKPKLMCPVEAIIGGDATVEVISAASILAKVARDAMMVEFDALYPQYGFAQHKGYPTKAHIAAIQQYGIIEIHRRSFRPVSLYVEEGA